MGKVPVVAATAAPDPPRPRLPAARSVPWPALLDGETQLILNPNSDGNSLCERLSVQMPARDETLCASTRRREQHANGRRGHETREHE